MTSYKLVVLTNSVEGREDEYNDWYSNRHLADVLKIPGIDAAQRFRLTEHQREPGIYPYSYLAVYECDTDDLREIVAEMKERSGTEKMPMSTAMASGSLVCFFEEITERRVTED